MTTMEQRLRAHVAELASGPRPPGSAAHRRAREYILSHLRDAGFAAEEAPYRGGVNVLTTPRPDRPDLPLLVVGAHYDSLPHTPGADDNASAVATLLELAGWVGSRALAGATARLVLAAYDQEEQGLIGSTHHARRIPAPLLGMISLEMLGYTDRRKGGQRLPPELAGVYPDVGDFIGVVANEASRPLLNTVAAGMRRVEGLPVETLVVPGDGSSVAETRLSDHASFWDRGHPALMVTDTSFFRNPHYHELTDTPDTLDYPFLARVTAGVCLAVAGLLGIPNVVEPT